MEHLNSSLFILIVEDEEEAREILMQVLFLRYPDITFLEASDGRNAMECFTRHHPKIVVTDVNLPDMNGIELSSKIRAIDANIKFLAISAHNNDTIQKMSVEYGSNICGFITKPIEYVKLFAAIDQCISDVM